MIKSIVVINWAKSQKVEEVFRNLGFNPIEEILTEDDERVFRLAQKFFFSGLEVMIRRNTNRNQTLEVIYLNVDEPGGAFRQR